MDWFLIPNSKITKVTSINDIQTDGFSLFNEILLFIILLVIGIVCSIVFGLIRLFKCDTIYVNNEKFNAKSYDTDEVDKSDSNFYENVIKYIYNKLIIYLILVAINNMLTL